MQGAMNLAHMELHKRARKQGLWPIPSTYWGGSNESIITRMASDTGHSVKYVRRVLKVCFACDPKNIPPQYITSEDVIGLEASGRGKFKNKPNPVKRRGLAKAKRERERIHKEGGEPAPTVEELRTNGPQLALVQEQYAPVLTNGRRIKSSKRTTSYSTGFVPPSRVINATFISPEQIKARKGMKRFSQQ